MTKYGEITNVGENSDSESNYSTIETKEKRKREVEDKNDSVVN